LPRSETGCPITLINITNLLTLFRGILQLFPSANDERNGRNSNDVYGRASTSSLHSIASFAISIRSKETWKELCRDLHKAGVTAGMTREREDKIVDLFQGPSPPGAVEEIAEFESPALQPQVVSKVAMTHLKKKSWKRKSETCLSKSTGYHSIHSLDRGSQAYCAILGRRKGRCTAAIRGGCKYRSR